MQSFLLVGIYTPLVQNQNTKKQTEFAKLALTEWMEGSFDDNLKEIIESFLQYGLCIAELNYVYEKDNKIIFKDIKPRAPHTFKIYPDESGNLAEDGLRQYQTGGLVPMPIEKFIVYAYRKKFSNFWGRSDLIECYRPWFVKDQITKMHAIYLEKYAVPPIVAKYENMNPSSRNRLMAVLQTMRSSSTVVIPKNVEVDFLNAVANGGKQFLDACNIKTKSISKAILMPNQLGFNKVDVW